MLGPSEDPPHDPNAWPFTYGGGLARVSIDSLFSAKMVERFEDLACFLRSGQVNQEDAARKVDAVVAVIEDARKRLTDAMTPIRENLIRNAERLAVGTYDLETFQKLLALPYVPPVAQAPAAPPRLVAPAPPPEPLL
jgi:hypothetical protein